MNTLRACLLAAFGTLLCAQNVGMFRGDAAHTGVYPSTVTPTLASTKWVAKVGGRVLSSPLIHGTRVMLGTSEGRVLALHRDDGRILWSFKAKAAVNSSPAFGHGMVFVSSLDGQVYALDESTGKPVWTFQTEGERRFTAPGIHGAIPRTEQMPDPFDVFLSSPALWEGLLILGSGDGHVYALEGTTGALKWKFRTGNVVHASPAVAEGVVYVGSWDRNLYALDARTGAKLWAFQTGEDPELHNQEGIAGSAAVMEGTVFFGCRDGHFYAVDAATGTLRWRHDNHKGWVIASPAVQGDLVCFPTSDGTRFKVLDKATGALRFERDNKVVSFSSPALVNGVAFFGSSDGILHAVDVKTGQLKAQFQTDGHKLHRATYLDAEGRLNGRALYPDFTLDGMVLGLDRMFRLGSILSSPAVADGVLYVGTADGQVLALN